MKKSHFKKKFHPEHGWTYLTAPKKEIEWSYPNPDLTHYFSHDTKEKLETGFKIWGIDT